MQGGDLAAANTPVKIPSRGFLLLLPAVLITLACYTSPPMPAQEVVQIATYPALQMGLCDGNVTHAQLGEMGDFGVGTF
jgi:hypothetical protein